MLTEQEKRELRCIKWLKLEKVVAAWLPDYLSKEEKEAAVGYWLEWKWHSKTKNMRLVRRVKVTPELAKIILRSFKLVRKYENGPFLEATYTRSR